MDTHADQPKRDKAMGFASILMGIIILAIYLLAIGVGAILVGLSPGSNGLGDMLGILWTALIFTGSIANLIGILLGMLSRRRTPRVSERRFAGMGIVLNTLPLLVLCLGYAYLAVMAFQDPGSPLRVP
jgi:hypothetical protein